MHLILYLGPVCLMAAVIFGIIGNTEALEMAVMGWLVFTFFGIIEKPRTLPEAVMTWVNAFIFAAAILFVLVTGYGMD